MQYVFPTRSSIRSTFRIRTSILRPSNLFHARREPQLMPKDRTKRQERTEFGEPWGWNGGHNVVFVREQDDSDSESTSTAQSSNSATHVSELASLCVEVVERILSFLSGNDIVACKRVSVRSRVGTRITLPCQWFHRCRGGFEISSTAP